MMVERIRPEPVLELPRGITVSQAPNATVILLAGLVVPLSTYEAIVDYVYLGRQPNDFLRAVLCNDLVGACQHADRLNAVYLRDTVLFVYNHCPPRCCGSAERVTEWLGRCLNHFGRVKA